MPSSVVAHMQYDQDSHTLWITYVSGMIYGYLQVPERAYEAMKQATSKGKYLNEQIKGKYAFIRKKQGDKK